MTLNNFGRLDAAQKKFIETKVKELKTTEAVKKYYHKPCLVARYALSVVKKNLK